MTGTPSKSADGNDFPTWLAPSIVKELRQGMKTATFTITWGMIPIGMALLFLFGFMTDNRGNPIIEGEAINAIFWVITIVTLLVITPARAFGSIKGEIDSRTIDLMVLTRLTPFKIVLGKWCSYMIQSLLIFSTLLPFFFMRYYYGNINLANEMVMIALILVASSILTAMAIWTSGFSVIARIIITVFLGAPLIIFGVQMAIAMVFVGGMFSSTWTTMFIDYSVLSSLVVLADAVIAFFIFIYLASRWIAPPSDNSSLPVRLLTLAALLPLPVCLLADGPYLSTAQGIFALFLATTVSAIELTIPMKILPVHLASVRGTRFSFFKTRCLMPGFYSASLFLMFYTLLLLVVTATLLITNGDLKLFASSLFEPITVNQSALLMSAAMLILLWFFSVHAPSMILYPVQDKLKSGTLILYYAISAFVIPIFGAMAVMGDKLLTLFVPWACLSYPFRISRDANHAEYMGLLSIGSLITVVITVVGIVMITNCNTRWKLAKLRAKKLPYLD